MTDQTVDSVSADNPDLEAEQPQRPEWLPQNFENEQALLASYREAEAALKRAQQEAATERAARAALEAQQNETVQAQQYQARHNDLVSRYEQAYENGDVQSMLAINAYVAQQAAAQALQQQAQPPTLPADFVATYATQLVSSKFNDYDQYQDRVAGYLAQNQYLVADEVAGNPNLLAQRLELAYKAVKADDLLSGNLPQQAPDLSLAKQQAQTMSGAGTRQPAADDAEAYWQRIANAPSRGFSTT